MTQAFLVDTFAPWLRGTASRTPLTMEHAMHLVSELLPGTHVDAIVRLPRYDRLTQAEREEVLRIAQGFTPGDSAAAVNISSNRMRARRSRIYSKLRVECAAELRAVILSLARRYDLDPGDESMGSRDGSGYLDLTGGG